MYWQPICFDGNEDSDSSSFTKVYSEDYEKNCRISRINEKSHNAAAFILSCVVSYENKIMSRPSGGGVAYCSRIYDVNV